jgi:peptidoglycan hydrolase-like protein with peptidoglycan-binding domain
MGRVLRRVFPAFGAALALVAAACSGGATPTTVSTTTSSTTTTTLGDIIVLEQNGPAFIIQGQRGAYVEALQHYLVCDGYAEPVPGEGEVSVDGVFGPITGRAVAYLQASLRRVPSGNPDEGTFAMLARECSEDRDVVFTDRNTVQQIAGNVAEDDDEVFTLSGVEGRVFSIVVSEGEVEVTIEREDGTQVRYLGPGGSWAGQLPSESTYSVRVAATVPTSYLVDLEAARPHVVNIDFGDMYLGSGGIGIAAFGDDADVVIEQLIDLLGEPSGDTDWQTGDAGGQSCRGTNRHLSWVVQAAESGSEIPALLTIDFSDVSDGTRVLAQYTYESDDPRAVDIGAMALATAEGVTIGRSRDEFVAIYGQPSFFDATRGLAWGGGIVFGITAIEEGEDLIYYVGAGADGCDDFS